MYVCMYACMYVCMCASSVSKRQLQHGGRALVPPLAAFLKEQATSALGPVAHKAPGPEPFYRAARCVPVEVWRPLKALINF